MAVRTKKGEATRRRVIEAAADLFHMRGTRATTPEDIIEAAGIGKGQFYYYFESKSALIHEVLQWHLQMIEGGQGPIRYQLDTWDDLEGWLLRHVEVQQWSCMARACPFGTIAAETNQEDELLRADINRILDAISSRLVRFFVKEKALGRMRSDADEDRLADFCLAAVQGAMLVGMIRRDRNAAEGPLREAFEHVRSYCV